MDELLSEFLTECTENMTVLDVELVKLEKNPNDRELIGSIFRVVHTIKGTCGFLGLSRLEAVAHSAENVLGKFRDGELDITPDGVSVILAALDRIKDILAVLEQTQAEPEGDDAELVARLNAVVEGTALHPQAVDSTDEPGLAAAADPMSEESFTEDSAMLAVPTAATSHRTGFAQAVERPTAAPQVAPVDAVASLAPRLAPNAPAEDRPKDAAAPAAAGPSGGGAVGGQSLRVQVEVLEKLMTLVGELVLTRNQLLQMVRNAVDSEFKAPLQRLSHITSELQDGVMKTRMQPIGNAWSKLPRIVRDLGIDLGKHIDLRMYGAETELDRQVLDLIKDPLTHMVRNSADHGLETIEERRSVGKPETGIITLDAFHEGGHIIIRIADDGRGLNVDRLRDKAIAQGLCSEAEAATLSQQQIHQFIFKAGFSTAAAITNVSGRGVGMDVVKTNIEKIGGSIELQSEFGRGTTFTIRIPLTLAIVAALIVDVKGERFAIPQIGVVELVRAGPRSEHRIEIVDGARILRLRNQLLPLVGLCEFLGLASGAAQTSRDQAYVVVAQVGATMFGIVVDQVFDTEEIVVKPVAPILRNVGVYSGNTILGDGSVVMILDLNTLASGLDLDTSNARSHLAKSEQATNADATSLLIFKAGAGGPKAVPLGLVTRLEEVEADAVEHNGHQTVMQYRGSLMPIVEIDGSAVAMSKGTRPLLVFSDAGRNLGLVVDEIVDIKSSIVHLEMKGGTESTLGSAIIAGKSTELLDVGFYVNRIFGGWFADQETDAFQSEAVQQSRRLLLVDDSPFFRNLLSPLLTAEGYMVTVAASPKEALKLRDDGQQFDIIISDIEMPEMDGFGFASACRAGGAWKRTPMIALTSHDTPKDKARGEADGFDGFVGKLDREALMACLYETLSSMTGPSSSAH